MLEAGEYSGQSSKARTGDDCAFRFCRGVVILPRPGNKLLRQEIRKLRVARKLGSASTGDGLIRHDGHYGWNPLLRDEDVEDPWYPHDVTVTIEQYQERIQSTVFGETCGRINPKLLFPFEVAALNRRHGDFALATWLCGRIPE